MGWTWKTLKRKFKFKETKWHLGIRVYALNAFKY